MISALLPLVYEEKNTFIEAKVSRKGEHILQTLEAGAKNDILSFSSAESRSFIIRVLHSERDLEIEEPTPFLF